MASFLSAARRPGVDLTGVHHLGIEPPPVPAWSGPLLEHLAATTGVDVGYRCRPEPLDHAQGPWAFGFALAGTELPELWRSPLVVRLGTHGRDLEKEDAAMAISNSHGLRAPTTLLRTALVRDDDDTELGVLVSQAVDAVALPELIGFNLHHSDDLLRGFARHHAEIHALPTTQAHEAIPTVSAPEELERIDRTRFAAELDWLRDRLPEPGPTVLAHGGYQPLAVSGPPPEQWEEAGGPGRGLIVSNWCGSVLADREFDVAFTLVAFWSAPFFAPNRSERTAIKMIRNTLLNTYKQGYTAVHDVDADRLRFWQAFHALRGLARMTGGYDEHGSTFAPQDRGELPADLAPELQRHVRQLTRVR